MTLRPGIALDSAIRHAANHILKNRCIHSGTKLDIGVHALPGPIRHPRRMSQILHRNEQVETQMGISGSVLDHGTDDMVPAVDDQTLSQRIRITKIFQCQAFGQNHDTGPVECRFRIPSEETERENFQEIVIRIQESLLVKPFFTVLDESIALEIGHTGRSLHLRIISRKRRPHRGRRGRIPLTS